VFGSAPEPPRDVDDFKIIQGHGGGRRRPHAGVSVTRVERDAAFIKKTRATKARGRKSGRTG
jgi:hypothetical protein